MQINAAKDSANISFQSILLCASLNLTRMSARRLIFAFSPCSELPGSNRLEAGTPRAAPICLAAGHSNDKCRTSDATSLPQSPQPRVVTLSRSPLCHPPDSQGASEQSEKPHLADAPHSGCPKNILRHGHAAVQPERRLPTNLTARTLFPNILLQTNGRDHNLALPPSDMTPNILSRHHPMWQ